MKQQQSGYLSERSEESLNNRKQILRQSLSMTKNFTANIIPNVILRHSERQNDKMFGRLKPTKQHIKLLYMSILDLTYDRVLECLLDIYSFNLSSKIAYNSSTRFCVFCSSWRFAPSKI